MRILTKSILCLSLLLSPSVTNAIRAEAAAPPLITLNGETKVFQHPPRVIDGRTFLPMRETLESLGATVHWDPQTRTVTASKQTQTVQLKVGSLEAYVNHRLVYLEQPAQIINDATFVPLRFVGQALGATITWDERTRTVSIITERTIEPELNPTVTIWHDEQKYLLDWLHESLIDFNYQMDQYFEPRSEVSKKDRFELAKEIDDQYRNYRNIYEKAKSTARFDPDMQDYLKEYAAAVDHIKDTFRLSSRYRTIAREHFENCQTLYDRMATKRNLDNDEKKLIQQIRNDAPLDQENISFQLITREDDKTIIHFIVPPSPGHEGYSVTNYIVSTNGQWVIDKKTEHRTREDEEDLITAIERRYRSHNFKNISVKRFMYEPSRGVYRASVFSTSWKGGRNVFIDPFTKKLWEEE